MREKLSAAYFANIITQLGSNLAFIPLGTYLDLHFGTGRGFALLLIFMQTPPVILARPYARGAKRRGTTKFIALLQLLAFAFSLVAILAVQIKSVPLLLLAMALTFSSGTALQSLFPAVLQQAAENDAKAQKHFADWYMIRHAAIIGARVLGGYLTAGLPLAFFLAFDALTFAVAAGVWLWLRFPKSKSVGPDLPIPWHSLKPFLQYANLTNMVRNVAYGIFNSIFAVIVIDRLHGKTENLGNLFLIAGVAAMLGGKLAGHVKITVPVILGLIVGEFAFMYFGLTGDRLPLFFAYFFLNITLMGIAEVGLQTLFMRDKSMGSLELRSSLFNSAESAANIVGYSAFLLIAHRVDYHGIVIFLMGLGAFSLFAFLNKPARDFA